ncbi:MAG: holo-[acyl-carrier-protein] synthase [Roseibacillus sp.]|nr:holo-[acyl-carrier-protein] synthase [Roseibacillus sp.]|tara:strand:- start:3915 stop:4301 length:387 start_codon:yes stop_codon:yes gene_type:complete
MRIFGIGIDVIEIERVEKAIEAFGDRFLARIFTVGERDYCLKQNRPAVHFAARWSAKEATSKALGTGIGELLSWGDMEIVRRQTGEPEMVLSGEGLGFCSQHGIDQIKISLTHAKLYAAANAVAISIS